MGGSTILKASTEIFSFGGKTAGDKDFFFFLMKLALFQAAKLPPGITEIYDSPIMCYFLSIFIWRLLVFGRVQHQIVYPQAKVA